jgi:hypothetical protein
MKHFKLLAILISAWVTLATPANAQFTPLTVYTDSFQNTALGTNALDKDYNVTGCSPCGAENTASGVDALQENTSGSYNSASGYLALNLNEIGSYNTAAGVNALLSNNGNYNTASGYQALSLNTTGINNTAFGALAMRGVSEMTGSNNTAAGESALFSDTAGSYNTASGYEAMYDNTVGAQNSAYGFYALHGNGKGNFNAAVGGYALFANTTGSNNVAIGYKAGFYPTAGANNIHIGNLGVAGDTDLIRIGTQGAQKAVYIAGASTAITIGTSQSVAALFVDTTTGQVGLQGSSERFKTAIEPMGSVTAKIEALRPVSFRYKSDPHGPRQFGLIAEEVAKVYPELVVRDAKGQILTVRYDELAPMLLNEIKLQNQKLRRLDTQDAEIRELRAEVRALQASQRSN